MKLGSLLFTFEKRSVLTVLKRWESMIYGPGMVMCKVRVQEKIEETEQMLFTL